MALLKCTGAPPNPSSQPLVHADPHHGFKRFLRSFLGQRRVPKLHRNDVVRSSSLMRGSQTGMYALRISEKF